MKGEKIVLRVLEIVKESESNFDDKKKSKLLKLIEPFILEPEDLDLMTISKLEVILGEDLLLIPNKQQWRKIKLDNINKLTENT